MHHQMNPNRACTAAALFLAAFAGSARAGGSAENILLIVNPASAESMYVADYYKNVRNIPDANILYMEPTASNDSSIPALYSAASGLNGNLDGLSGFLANAAIANHIDYIVVANTGAFYTDAPGYITDGCSPVGRLSQASLFTTAFMKTTILAGNVPSTMQNQYFNSSPNQPPAFSSATLWLGGNATTSPSGKRYYIGAQLGYTGANGNTLAEVLAMIDRAAAADGTHPPGTFYFINTTDTIRNVRSPQFPAVVSDIIARGGSATILNGIIPDFHFDNLGIMTGWPDPPVDGGQIGPQPGSFCDHLTSWAATFDNPNQTKIASWIRRGAAGSAGEVEEPCNYTGKFPHAVFHSLYFQGMSMGEAWLRSVAYVPFQGLLYGDPITRPWATLPVVTGNIPSGTVSGNVVFTPAATTTLSGAAIAGFTLFIDGVQQTTRLPGQAFTIDTVAMPDGWHELRVLAWDNTTIKNTGRWIGSFTSNNYGRAATLGLNTLSGDMTTLFAASAAGTGGTVQELRLIQNGRVLAAAPGGAASLQAYGRNLGSGTSRVQVEALFADGRTARSAPASLNIAYTVGTFSGLAPVAYNYTKRVARGGPFVVELPARFDDALSGAAFTIVSPPTQGTTVGAGTRSTRIMTASPTACGQDQFTFRVTTASGQSNTATVTLVYGAGAVCPADVFPDGTLNILDFSAYLNLFAAGDPRADMDGNCTLNVLDFGAYLNAFAVGCP